MSNEPLVRDLMHPTVVSCTRDTAIPEVARRMTELDISALAVVDGEGYLEGLISRTSSRYALTTSSGTGCGRNT